MAGTKNIEFLECRLSEEDSKLFVVLDCFCVIHLLSLLSVIYLCGLSDLAIKSREICCRFTNIHIINTHGLI